MEINIRRPLAWQIAMVKAIRQENARVKTLTFHLPQWKPHLPGQHYDVRLTAPDGYQAQRSYSIASPPEREGEIDLTVEYIDGGEVSSYLHEVVIEGDEIEMRGPIGGYFVWQAATGGPLFLIAGGSGVVPFMAMLRHHISTGSQIPVTLLYSLRSPEDLIYRQELDSISQAQTCIHIVYTFTRLQPPDWQGYSRRIDRDMLLEILQSFEQAPKTYVCGPTQMVESAADLLLLCGLGRDQIRTERFGPSGNSS